MPDRKSAEMIWFDSHAHLQGEDFAEDLPEVLERARAAGVQKILLPAVDLEDSKRALTLALAHDLFCCSIGCHPHAAARFPADGIDQLREMIRQRDSSKLVAVGEIGLDYHYDFSPRDIQKDVFRSQLDLAFEADMPVIIHDREATADCLDILHQQQDTGRLRPMPGVFHCYSGSPETARQLLAMGFYIGVDGPITFKNARKTPEVIRICPHDRLLIETDSPYLTPVPYRGKRNEPAYLNLIGEKVAQIWEVEIDDVSTSTTANAKRLFGLS